MSAMLGWLSKLHQDNWLKVPRFWFWAGGGLEFCAVGDGVPATTHARMDEWQQIQVPYVLMQVYTHAFELIPLCPLRNNANVV